MKKSLIVVSLLVLAVTAFAADFNGGAARIEALGGQKIVVADISAANDLYDMGFSSGIFAREKKSFVSIIPTLDVYLMEQAETDDAGETEKTYLFGAGNAAELTQYEGAVIWLSKDSVITLKPYLSSMWGKEELYNNDAVSDKEFQILNPYTLGGVVEYAQKLGGVMLAGSLSYGKSAITMTDKTDEENFMTMDFGFDKLEYALSAAIDAGKGLSVAVNLGNKVSMFPDKTSGFRWSPFLAMTEDEEPLMHSLSGLEMSQLAVAPGMKMVANAKLTTEGFRTEVGAAMKGEGADLLSGKIGLTTGIKSSVKVLMRMYDTTDGSLIGEMKNNEVLFEDGTGINASVNLRKDVAGILLGLKCDFSHAEANDGNSAGKIKTTAYSVSTGAAIGNKKELLIPVELFVNGYDRKYTVAEQDDYTHQYDFGARAGVELMVGDMALRLGADYTAASHYTGDKISGVYDFQSAGAGTHDNPYGMQLGVNAGIGLKLFGAETNLSARFEPVWNQYKDEDLKTDSDNVIKLMADMKFYI